MKNPTPKAATTPTSEQVGLRNKAIEDAKDPAIVQKAYQDALYRNPLTPEKAEYAQYLLDAQQSNLSALSADQLARTPQILTSVQASDFQDILDAYSSGNPRLLPTNAADTISLSLETGTHIPFPVANMLSINEMDILTAVMAKNETFSNDPASTAIIADTKKMHDKLNRSINEPPMMGIVFNDLVARTKDTPLANEVQNII
ncbi:MAG: hypothetical protein J6N72_07855, partial [Psychrobacter sp.]|nr:hypothetical protein [Psychrobacter sp.]